MKTRIYLIRHAEAEGNIKRIFQGNLDADLSENAKQQLECLSKRCKELHFDAIYSSPLMRAYKTAQAANLYHKLPIVTLDGLKEIHGGCWEGEKWEELPTLYPEHNRMWVYEPWNFETEGGESMRAVYNRMRETVTGIVKKHAGQQVCVVSHGCAIRALLCWAQGKPIEEINSISWCDNTALSIIDFDETFKSEIVMLNDNSHLSDELSTLKKQDWWKQFEPYVGEV
jgi:broad specificity phosphatase PhoE